MLCYPHRFTDCNAHRQYFRHHRHQGTSGAFLFIPTIMVDGGFCNGSFSASRPSGRWYRIVKSKLQPHTPTQILTYTLSWGSHLPHFQGARSDEAPTPPALVVEKPQYDHREYHYTRLANGMQVRCDIGLDVDGDDNGMK